MRMAVLTQYYPPEPIPKPHELACGLAERGHNVVSGHSPATFSRISRIPETRYAHGNGRPTVPDGRREFRLKRTDVCRPGRMIISRSRHFPHFGNSRNPECRWELAVAKG
jgi:hypothetical protein